MVLMQLNGITMMIRRAINLAMGKQIWVDAAVILNILSSLPYKTSNLSSPVTLKAKPTSQSTFYGQLSALGLNADRLSITSQRQGSL